jgi:hypothetical protein
MNPMDYLFESIPGSPAIIANGMDPIGSLKFFEPDMRLFSVLLDL